MSTVRDLCLLVYGFSRQEKSEFERFADRQAGDTRYMQVYRVLEQITAGCKSIDQIPEEEILQRRLQLEIKGNTTAYRQYLMKTLLRSLRSNSQSGRQEDDIQQDIQNAKILARRGLFTVAIDVLESALRVAVQYQYHQLAIEALHELVYLEGQKDMKSYADNILQRLSQIEQLSAIQAMEHRFFGLHHRAFVLSRSRRLVVSEAADGTLEALRSDDLLRDDVSKHSFFSQVYHWQARASLAFLDGNTPLALDCSRRIIQLWQMDAYTHMQQEHPRRYIIHLQNFVNFAIGSGQFDAAMEVVNTMEAVPCLSFDDAAEQFQNVLFTRQLLLLHTGQFEAAVALVTEKMKQIQGEYRQKINTARLISLYYNTLSACFALRNYSEAQVWSDRIYKIGRSEQRRDIQFINKVFQIIIRFELGSFYKLDQEIKNTTQNLRDHEQLDKTNEVILQWLGKLIRNRLDNGQSAQEMAAQERVLFHDFREKIQEKKRLLANRQVIGLDEVLMWVEGRVGE